MNCRNLEYWQYPMDQHSNSSLIKNIDLQLIEKRKINNRKNTHRNYFKTIGRKILRYIESNNQKIQDILKEILIIKNLYENNESSK